MRAAFELAVEHVRHGARLVGLGIYDRPPNPWSQLPIYCPAFDNSSRNLVQPLAVRYRPLSKGRFCFVCDGIVGWVNLVAIGTALLRCRGISHEFRVDHTGWFAHECVNSVGCFNTDQDRHTPNVPFIPHMDLPGRLGHPKQLANAEGSEVRVCQISIHNKRGLQAAIFSICKYVVGMHRFI